MKKALLLLCSIILIIAACSSYAAPSTSAAPKSTEPNINVFTPPASVNVKLVGVYLMQVTEKDLADPSATTGYKPKGNILPGEWVLRFRSDGYFVLERGAYTGIYGPSVTPYDSFGQYSATESQVTVQDTKCWEYFGIETRSASYTWILQGNLLTFKEVGSDLCPARRFLFITHPWVWQPKDPYP